MSGGSKKDNVHEDWIKQCAHLTTSPNNDVRGFDRKYIGMGWMSDADVTKFIAKLHLNVA